MQKSVALSRRKACICTRIWHQTYTYTYIIQVHVHRVQSYKKVFLPVGSQSRVGRKCDHDVDNSAHAQGDVRGQGIDETSAAETNKLS